MASITSMLCTCTRSSSSHQQAGGTCSGTWPADQVTGQVSKAPNCKGTGRNEARRGKRAGEKTKAAKDLRHGSTAEQTRQRDAAGRGAIT
ncbi:hypothetical protein LI328DRAFT_138490 [Trichoderma asperelloides]|nr:hypothetical protein LI328DRAFT_138490 [Trichoderma asperelloides]